MLFDKTTVTRQQAARAEIDTAIELLFYSGSPIAIDVLTWAAVEMMRGIAEHRQLQTFQSMIEERIKPEGLKEWRRIQKEHYNFFKHADRDPSRESDNFMPEATTYSLFGAAVDYQVVFGQLTFAMLSYIAWFMARHPNFVLPPFSEMTTAFARHLGHPQDKPLRESLVEVATLYRDAKARPYLLEQLAESVGERFEK
jgi:hypothetical protein